MPGADAVMIFDTWGGLLTTDAYHSFSLDSMRAVLAALRPDRTGDTFPRSCSPKAAGNGSMRSPRAARSASGSTGRSISPLPAGASAHRVALQGNLDPLVLLADAKAVAREATAVVRAAGAAPGHIFNLGHGIVPSTPPDNVAVLVETVHRESRAVRAGPGSGDFSRPDSALPATVFRDRENVRKGLTKRKIAVPPRSYAHVAANFAPVTQP